MSKELTVEYIPSLIVAKDVNGLYIPIGSADKYNEYYCPVCNNIVKPRALNSKKEQPHYYHVNDECSKESQLHWLYKNWLLVENTEVIIGDKTYVVKDCEIEPIIKTKFGVYNPDLKITTMDNKVFYFEMAYSNKKDQTYSDKWDDLGAEVVEIDIKELINSNNCSVLPKFNYIYTNGKYTQEYEKRERKDKFCSFKNAVNYDARENMISDLNWLWNEINNEDIVEICLDNIDYEILVDVTRWFKQIKCVDKYEYLLKYCKNRYYNNLTERFPLAHIEIISVTPRTLEVVFTLLIGSNEYFSLKIPCTTKSNDRLIDVELTDKFLEDNYPLLLKKYHKFEEYYNDYITLTQLELGEDCSYSFYNKKNAIHVLLYKEYNGKQIQVLDSVLNKKTIENIQKNLNKFDEVAKIFYNNNEIIKDCIEDFDKNVDYYNRKLKNIFCEWFYVERKFNTYKIKTFEERTYNANLIEDVIKFKTDLAELLDDEWADGYNERIPLIDLSIRINHCNNGYWHLSCINYNEYILYLYENDNYISNESIILEDRFYGYDELKELLTKTMIHMIENPKSYNTRMFLEVLNG